MGDPFPLPNATNSVLGSQNRRNRDLLEPSEDVIEGLLLLEKRERFERLRELGLHRLEQRRLRILEYK